MESRSARRRRRRSNGTGEDSSAQQSFDAVSKVEGEVGTLWERYQKLDAENAELRTRMEMLEKICRSLTASINKYGDDKFGAVERAHKLDDAFVSDNEPEQEMSPVTLQLAEILSPCGVSYFDLTAGDEVYDGFSEFTGGSAGGNLDAMEHGSRDQPGFDEECVGERNTPYQREEPEVDAMDLKLAAEDCEQVVAGIRSELPRVEIMDKVPHCVAMLLNAGVLVCSDECSVLNAVGDDSLAVLADSVRQIGKFLSKVDEISSMTTEEFDDCVDYNSDPGALDGWDAWASD